MPNQPEIVCLCGSMRFAEQLRTVARELTLEGTIVLAPSELDPEVAASHRDLLSELHLRRIDLADRVLVVNPGGHVGVSTEREIAYARRAGIPVSFTDNA